MGGISLNSELRALRARRIGRRVEPLLFGLAFATLLFVGWQATSFAVSGFDLRVIRGYREWCASCKKSVYRYDVQLDGMAVKGWYPPPWVFQDHSLDDGNAIHKDRMTFYYSINGVRQFWRWANWMALPLAIGMSAAIGAFAVRRWRKTEESAAGSEIGP